MGGQRQATGVANMDVEKTALLGDSRRGGSALADASLQDAQLTAGASARVLALQIFSAVLYGSTAVLMNFVNKYMMQVFPLTNVVVALQMACTWAILQALRKLGYIHFPAFNWQKAKQLSGITVLYTANTVFSLVGLKTLNIPMYNVLKRLTPVFILVLKAVYRKQRPPTDITLSVAVIVGGCIIAGIGDLAFDLWGYIYALLSCTSQALYLLIVEFQGSDFNVGSTEMLYYNAITSLPLLALLVVAIGEGDALPAVYAKGVQQAGEAWFMTIVMSCALMGMLLNYAQFLCTTTNSALTTTIVGVAKGVLAVMLGFFFLGGVPYSPVNIAGITLNTVGVIWYTYIKYNQRAASHNAWLACMLVKIAERRKRSRHVEYKPKSSDGYVHPVREVHSQQGK